MCKKCSAYVYLIIEFFNRLKIPINRISLLSYDSSSISSLKRFSYCPYTLERSPTRSTNIRYNRNEIFSRLIRRFDMRSSFFSFLFLSGYFQRDIPNKHADQFSLALRILVLFSRLYLETKFINSRRKICM